MNSSRAPGPAANRTGLPRTSGAWVLRAYGRGSSLWRGLNGSARASAGRCVRGRRRGKLGGAGRDLSSRYAKEVQIVVRRSSLREHVRQYLIDQIETANIPNAAHGGRRCRRKRPRGTGCAQVARRRNKPDRRLMRSLYSSAPGREATGFLIKCCAPPVGLCRRRVLSPERPAYARIWSTW